MSGSDRKYVPTKLTPEMLGTLLAIRGELPVKVFLLLADLGAHLESGWLGSIATLTAKLGEKTGRPGGQTEVGEAVAKLVEAVLLRVEGSERGRRRFYLGSRETREQVHGKPVSGSRETREQVHGKPVSLLTLEKEERREEKGGESARHGARVRDVRGIPVRNGQPILGAADGLAEEVLAAGLRLSERQVELLVGEVGSDEVRRQLGWWSRRDRGWCDGKSGAQERWFSKLCRERELEPINGDGGSKPLLSPDAVAVLRSELRDRRVTKGAVAGALRSVGAPDLEHLTAESRRALLAALEAS